MYESSTHCLNPEAKSFKKSAQEERRDRRYGSKCKHYTVMINQRVNCRVVQTARSPKITPSLGIFPFILIYWIGKCKIFWKKLSFCPCLRVIFVYYYRYVVTGKQFPFYDQNLPLNVAISTSNPPRTKQEVKNIDQSLLDIKNSLIGGQNRLFFTFWWMA